MKWLDSFREEHARRKEDDQALLCLYQEILREFYIGPDYKDKP